MNIDKKDMHIFSGSHHLTRGELVRYSTNALSEAEKHIMEKHLVDCELCSDALEGIAEMRNASALYEVSRELHLRARKKHMLRKKIFSQNELIAIFSVVFLILFIIMISLVFFSRKSNDKSPMEIKKEQKQ
jgi:hypothetical protein